MERIGDQVALGARRDAQPSKGRLMPVAGRDVDGIRLGTKRIDGASATAGDAGTVKMRGLVIHLHHDVNVR